MFNSKFSRGLALAISLAYGMTAGPLFSQVSMTGAGLGAPPSGAATSTWNPADKASAVVLSNGNLTATDSTSANAWALVRGTKSYTTGTSNKVVFLFTTAAIDPGSGWIGGVADATAGLTSSLGSSGNAYGFYVNVGLQASGNVTGSNNCAGTGVTAPSGKFYYAVNFSTRLLWCSTDCVTWPGGTPDAGTGGAATLGATTAFFPAWSGQNNGGTDTAILSTTPNLSGCTGISTFTDWN